MGEYATRAWCRFGHDRTYVVDTATGAQLGYRDNHSGSLVASDATTAGALFRWAELHHAGVLPNQVHEVLAVPVGNRAAVVPRVDGAVPARSAPTPREHSEDEDLAGRRAGHAARLRADSELAILRAERGRFRAWLGRVFDLRTDERAWRVGANGEVTIGAELERLVPRGWRILHSVPVGERDSDIDHVLIGPGGVFTVNSKHHPGARVWVVPRQIRVNNQPVPYLRNSRHEAARAERLLSSVVSFPVPVTPVLIFRLGRGSLTIREEPDDVLVFRATKAVRPLRRRYHLLTEAQVEEVFEAARWRSTWQPGLPGGRP